MIRYLCQRIGEEMEKFHEYNGLTGLRASELMIKGTKKVLPENGRIGDHIKNSDDIITFDILSEEIWLFVGYDLNCDAEGSQKRAAVELKVAKDCTLGYLRMVIEKLAMNLWSFSSSQQPRFYYVLKQLIIKLAQMPKTYDTDHQCVIEDRTTCPQMPQARCLTTLRRARRWAHSSARNLHWWCVSIFPPWRRH